jgi:hypothetical protein
MTAEVSSVVGSLVSTAVGPISGFGQRRRLARASARWPSTCTRAIVCGGGRVAANPRGTW